jgi:hypothetical protein
VDNDEASYDPLVEVKAPCFMAVCIAILLLFESLMTTGRLLTIFSSISRKYRRLIRILGKVEGAANEPESDI